MTVDQVIALLGPADSTELAEDGYEVSTWRRNSIRAVARDPSLSCTTFLTAEVKFRGGAVVLVFLEYRLVV